MMKEKREKPRFRLLGGRLCLDFANTVDWHKSPRPGEKLNDCADLAAWAQTAQLLDEQEAQRAIAYATRHPGKGIRILRRAITLREAVYAIFSAAAEGRKIAEKDLERLSSEVLDAASHRRLTAAETGYSWMWTDDGGSRRLIIPLREVAESAVQLLTSPELCRVRICADDRGCGWLFLDTSRAGKRKWCDIRDCGNRAKARRHYQRKRNP